MKKKLLDQKDKFTFKTSDVTAWLVNNYDTHIAQRQPDNEIWSVNRIYPEKYFSLKNYAENEAGKLVSDRFLSFKKALYQVKASGLQLDFTIF